MNKSEIINKLMDNSIPVTESGCWIWENEVNNGNVKLTENQVTEIRNSLESSSELSSKYSVCTSTIRRIKTKKIWRHL